MRFLTAFAVFFAFAAPAAVQAQALTCGNGAAPDIYGRCFYSAPQYGYGAGTTGKPQAWDSDWGDVAGGNGRVLRFNSAPQVFSYPYTAARRVYQATPRSIDRGGGSLYRDQSLGKWNGNRYSGFDYYAQ